MVKSDKDLHVYERYRTWLSYTERNTLTEYALNISELPGNVQYDNALQIWQWNQLAIAFQSEALF